MEEKGVDSLTRGILSRRQRSRGRALSPPSGPPETIKPAHEMLGEVLLKAGRPTEARQQFATALLRQPNRARSLLGAARAAAKTGDSKAAVATYEGFLQIYGDFDLREPSS